MLLWIIVDIWYLLTSHLCDVFLCTPWIRWGMNNVYVCYYRANRRLHYIRTTIINVDACKWNGKHIFKFKNSFCVNFRLPQVCKYERRIWRYSKLRWRLSYDIDVLSGLCALLRMVCHNSRHIFYDNFRRYFKLLHYKQARKIGNFVWFDKRP